MRTQQLRTLFTGVFFLVATTGGLPCSSCPDDPAHTEVVPTSPSNLPGAGMGDGFFLDDAGVVQLSGDAGVMLPDPACAKACSLTEVTHCRLEPGDGGAQLACDVPAQPGQCGGGRRTRGVGLGRVIASTPVGDYFGACAALEAASVRSFRRLRSELGWLGAPRSLLRACGRAARDEARHARVLSALARREGGRVGAAREEPLAPRSLEELATENAVEGCVNETFGALLAQWQATHAAGNDVRGVLVHVARDETQHAALAWSMAAWLEQRLSPAARARVRTARTRARERLVEQLSAAPHATLIARGVLPPPSEALALAQALAAALPA
jgi:hypothetical protein